MLLSYALVRPIGAPWMTLEQPPAETGQAGAGRFTV